MPKSAAWLSRCGCDCDCPCFACSTKRSSCLSGGAGTQPYWNRSSSTGYCPFRGLRSGQGQVWNAVSICLYFHLQPKFLVTGSRGNFRSSCLRSEPWSRCNYCRSAPWLPQTTHRNPVPTKGRGEEKENWLVDWFNAELPQKRYWRGPRSQKARKEGDYA